jgi:hypothetical protein
MGPSVLLRGAAYDRIVVQLGPDDGSLIVKTYREGLAARAGHDLVLDVTRWRATLDDDRVTLTADPHSLRVREALHGVKPLTDRDRDEILRNIEEKVLGDEPITFTGAVTDHGDHLHVDGELTLAGARRPKRTGVTVADGRATATIPLRQSEWDIQPYRGLMGTLRVRDEIEVVLDVRLPQRPV